MQERPREDLGGLTHPREDLAIQPVSLIYRLPRWGQAPVRLAGHVALTAIVVEALHLLGWA